MAASATTPGGAAVESALSKARWRIIPLLGLCYLIAYMDRVNISFAAESMNRDLHFTAQVYGLGAGLFFVSYAACEIPSNRLLLKFGARRWIARIMLTWGLLAAAMVFVHGPRAFYGFRLLLGMAEAGYFPGVIYYLAQWFPARERARAVGWFYIAFPLSSSVMGALAGGLLRLDGTWGLHGWQWLFLVEALPAVLMSVVVWRLLPDGPGSATWLRREEKLALEEELTNEPSRREAKAHGNVTWRALTDSRVLGLGLFFFCTLGSNYAVQFSLPAMLRVATGWDTGRVGQLVILFGVLGAVSMLVNAYGSDRSGERRWHVALPALLLGASVLAAGLGHGWIAVAALAIEFIAFFAIQGPLLSVPMTIFAGEAAAVNIAVINMCAIVGGFVGPYWMGWMHDRTGSYAMGTAVLCVPCWLASALIVRMLRVSAPIPS